MIFRATLVLVCAPALTEVCCQGLHKAEAYRTRHKYSPPVMLATALSSAIKLRRTMLNVLCEEGIQELMRVLTIDSVA
jgi:hypothetical protein